MFNEDLLTQCREPQFKEQYIEMAPPPDMINEKEEYKIKSIKLQKTRIQHIILSSLKEV